MRGSAYSRSVSRPERGPSSVGRALHEGVVGADGEGGAPGADSLLLLWVVGRKLLKGGVGQVGEVGDEFRAVPERIGR